MSIAMSGAGDRTYHSPEGCGLTPQPASHVPLRPRTRPSDFPLPRKGGEGLKVRRQVAPTELKPRPKTVKFTNGAQAEAPRRLGLSHTDLGYKIVKYGISDCEDKSVEYAPADYPPS